MADKNTFVLRMSYAPILADMTNEQAGQLIKAIFAYVSKAGDFSEIKDPGLKMAAKFIKQDLDFDMENYIKKCNKNAENARKSGKNKANASERKRTLATASQKSERKHIDNDVDVDNDVDNDSDIKTTNPPKPPLEDSLEYSQRKLGKPFVRWVTYRRQIKKPYKSLMSLDECYKKLERLSGGDVVIAERVVNQSIAQGWQGLFELKKEVENVGTDYNRNAEPGKYAGFGRKFES